MKKCFIFLFLFLFLCSSTALAIPSLPAGPLYIKFDNREQLSSTGSITAPSGNNESNWGIFRVSTLATGDASTNPQNFPSDEEFWTNGDGGGSITGIFAGLELHDPSTETIFNSSNGQIHFYYNDFTVSLNDATPSDRTNDYKFTNFTDGTFLGAAEFVNGAIIDGESEVSVTGNAIPTGDSFTGIANSYANIIDFNDDGVIDENDGLWAPLLANKYFNTQLGSNTADIKLRNIYEGPLSSWDGDGDILGAESSDPLRTNAVPEPGTLLLFGTGLLGLAAFGRKKFMKKS